MAKKILDETSDYYYSDEYIFCHWNGHDASILITLVSSQI